MSADEVVSYFLDEFKKAKIDDPVQRQLYERDGIAQLRTIPAIVGGHALREGRPAGAPFHMRNRRDA